MDIIGKYVLQLLTYLLILSYHSSPAKEIFAYPKVIRLTLLCYLLEVLTLQEVLLFYFFTFRYVSHMKLIFMYSVK